MSNHVSAYYVTSKLSLPHQLTQYLAPNHLPRSWRERYHQPGKPNHFVLAQRDRFSASKVVLIQSKSLYAQRVHYVFMVRIRRTPVQAGHFVRKLVLDVLVEVAKSPRGQNLEQISPLVNLLLQSFLQHLITKKCGQNLIPSQY